MSPSRDAESEPPRPPSTWATYVAERHQTELVGHTRARLGSLAGYAEDLVADVLGDLAEARFDSRRIAQEQALPFVKRVLSHEAMHRLRVQRRFEPLPEALPDPGYRDAWAQASRAEATLQLRLALEDLTVIERRALDSYYLQGYSVAELAEADAVSQAAIWQRLARGRRKLRRLLHCHNSLEKDE